MNKLSLALVLLCTSVMAQDLGGAFARQAAALKKSSEAMKKRVSAQAKARERMASDGSYALDPKVMACQALADKQPVYYRGWELKLVTERAAFFTHEDCDICDELEVCEFRDPTRMQSVMRAHRVSCADLEPFRKGKIAFDACK